MNTNIKTPPCVKCTDRSIGCHGKCAKYLNWRKMMDALPKDFPNTLNYVRRK